MGDYLDHNKPMGANVKRLLAIHSSNVSIKRYGGGIAGSVEGIKNMASVAREAMGEIEQMIQAVKSAPDNPYGDDDEVIVGEILRQYDERKQKSDTA
jgi:hypothetical protein